MREHDRGRNSRQLARTMAAMLALFPERLPYQESGGTELTPSGLTRYVIVRA